MASQLVASGSTPDDFEDQEDLSNEQMRALLLKAEEQMRAAVAVETPSDDTIHLWNAPYAEDTQILPRIPRLKTKALAGTYVSTTNGVAYINPRRLLNDSDRSLSGRSRRVEYLDPREKHIGKGEKTSAGPSWFDLPRSKMTPELKRDLQLLKMRGVLDPKRHYKKDDAKSLAPEFFQIGTVIEGPAEYFSSRVPNRERKTTLINEVLENERSTGHFKRKYSDIQAAKTSGKKAFYNKLKQKRNHGTDKR